MELEHYIRMEDLVNNPSARIPVCLCLDTSDSMNALIDTTGAVSTGETRYKDGQMYTVVKGGGETRLEALQAGVEEFYRSLQEHEDAKDSAEISLVTFDSEAKCIQDFGWLEKVKSIPKLKTNGDTHMGEGINLALDLLVQRKEEYKETGVDYFQPWLVIMTDGIPNGNQAELDRAIERVNKMVDAKKLVVIPIAVGDDADMEVLKRFHSEVGPKRLQGVQFKQFFKHLGASVKICSQSIPGEEDELTAMISWDDF